MAHAVAEQHIGRREGGALDCLFAGLFVDQAFDRGCDEEQFVDAKPAGISCAAAGFAPSRPAERTGKVCRQAKFPGEGCVGHVTRLAVGTKAPHQALRKDRAQGGRKQEALDAHVAQARDGAGGAVGVHGGQRKAARERELERDFRRFGIADLADHHDVRIIAQDGAQCGGEGQADLVVHRRLADPVETILDRVFQRHDVDAARVQHGEGRIQRRRLA